MKIDTIDNKKFFDGWRKEFKGAKLTQKRVKAIDLLFGFIEDDVEIREDHRHVAYMLATVYHETGKTMSPIKEILQRSTKTARQRKLKARQAEYSPYYGRGYVQITWLDNYLRLGKIIADVRWEFDQFNDDWLVADPDRALDPEVSYWIMSIGMRDGLFTSKGLNNYINNDKCDYKGARRIVNGTDKASLIAGIAKKFESILDKSANILADKEHTDSGLSNEDKISISFDSTHNRITDLYDEIQDVINRVNSLEKTRSTWKERLMKWIQG